jgi:hypothetical protein
MDAGVDAGIDAGKPFDGGLTDCATTAGVPCVVSGGYVTFSPAAMAGAQHVAIGVISVGGPVELLVSAGGGDGGSFAFTVDSARQLLPLPRVLRGHPTRFGIARSLTDDAWIAAMVNNSLVLYPATDTLNPGIDAGATSDFIVLDVDKDGRDEVFAAFTQIHTYVRAGAAIVPGLVSQPVPQGVQCHLAAGTGFVLASCPGGTTIERSCALPFDAGSCVDRDAGTDAISAATAAHLSRLDPTLSAIIMDGPALKRMVQGALGGQPIETGLHDVTGQPPLLGVPPAIAAAEVTSGRSSVFIAMPSTLGTFEYILDGGGFVRSTPLITPPSDPQDVATGDLDGDGKTDLVILTPNSIVIRFGD